ncbi:MAG: hypothetical protein IPK93_08425 [Solirubrobacterales bacterium]|nr:hypothetical protein [Solirubrobacterales bacterium]
MTRFVTCLIALLLVTIVGFSGLVDSTAGLLMLVPFAALLLPLLAGLYPGESVIESMAGLLEGSRSRARAAGRIGFSQIAIGGPGALIAGTLGSRGPPFGA